MSTDNNQIPPEELELETEASKEAKEEEIRQAVISDYGFDEVDDVEKINKLVAERVGSHKKLTTAIGQKIEYRKKALGTNAAPPADDKKKDQENKGLTPEDVDKRFNENMQKRDLSELDVPEEAKKEIEEWARFKNISVKEAARAPHIVSKIKELKEAAEAEGAGNGTKRKQTTTSTFTTTPPTVDMSTPEGRETWEKWKRWMEKR